jgi:hypothetical protein
MVQTNNLVFQYNITCFVLRHPIHAVIQCVKIRTRHLRHSPQIVHFCNKHNQSGVIKKKQNHTQTILPL